MSVVCATASSAWRTSSFRMFWRWRSERTTRQAPKRNTWRFGASTAASGDDLTRWYTCSSPSPDSSVEAPKRHVIRFGACIYEVCTTTNLRHEKKMTVSEYTHLIHGEHNQISYQPSCGIVRNDKAPCLFRFVHWFTSVVGGPHVRLVAQ